MLKWLFSALFSAGMYAASYSQCCGQSTPTGGVGNMGTLNRNALQVVVFHRYSSSVNQKADNPYLILDANYNFIGTSVSYGLTKKYTLETELGYFINKTQRYKLNPVYTLKGFGFSNGVVSVKRSLFKAEKSGWEIVGGLGLKFPFTTNYQMVDGVQLPIDNQPSTCAFGIVPKILVFKKYPKQKLTFLFIHRPDINFRNKNGYTYGSGFTSSLFVSKELSFISKNTTGVLQVRNEIRLNDIKTDGYAAETTGSKLLFISPQIGQVFGKNYFLSFTYDFPVYQQFNTEKLKYKQAFTFSFVMNVPNCKITRDQGVELNEETGISVSMVHQDTTFRVYGKCEMCKASIETRLLNLDGVDTAVWDIESNMLTLRYDPAKITPDKIKTELALIGYDTDSHRASKKAYKNLHACCKYERPG
ncbi:MAG: heavy-metal-associated domain-containing protein [Bacteroidetes bacterium]|nr:heavy-metal-associated domain-containing protein [Bacteroidota bacterium]